MADHFSTRVPSRATTGKAPGASLDASSFADTVEYQRSEQPERQFVVDTLACRSAIALNILTDPELIEIYGKDIVSAARLDQAIIPTARSVDRFAAIEPVSIGQNQNSALHALELLFGKYIFRAVYRLVNAHISGRTAFACAGVLLVVAFGAHQLSGLSQMHVSNKFGMLAVLIFGSHTLSALEDILAAIGAVFALLGIMATFAKSWISKLGFVTFRVVSQIIERLSWFK